jgi:probable HAF family extracellular repeat protein
MPGQPARAASDLPAMAGGVKYDLVPISLGGNISRITAINAKGQAVGWGKTRAGYTHAFLYANGMTIDLGSLSGNGNSEAYGINDNGQVVGWSHIAGNQLKHAFLYSAGVMTDLGTLCTGVPPVCGTESDAIAINASGQIVGTSYTPEGKQHAYRYSAGVMQDLGTLGGDFSYAAGINDSGVVIGSSWINPGAYSVQHGFVYQNGGMVNIGTFGGYNSKTIDINNSGQVSGHAAVSTDEAGHAFLFSGGTLSDLGLIEDDMQGDYTPQTQTLAMNESGQVVGLAITSYREYVAFTTGAGGLVSLGTLGGSSYAMDINNSGQIVGHSYSVDSLKAFVYSGGILSNLNTLIDQTAGVILSEAHLINDAGVIATFGNPGNRAYLLTPINGPYIKGYNPNSAAAGSADLTLLIAGLNFHNNSIIKWDGAALVTSYITDTMLTASVPAAKIASPGVHTINVYNPTSDGGTSNDRYVFVTRTGALVTQVSSASSAGSIASTTFGASGPGVAGSVTASATGTGTLVIGAYASNPGGGYEFISTSSFIDVHIKPGSAFTSLSLLDCSLNGGTQLNWWDGSAWKLASNQAYSAGTGCITVTVNNTTSPALADLSGTPFGAGVSGSNLYLPLIFR